MSYTVSQILNIAKISEYLFVARIEKGGLYAGGIDAKRPELIYNLRKSIEYIYNLDPTDESLVPTSNYLLSICDISAASVISASGTIASQNALNTPSPYIFTVDASTSFIIDGQSTKTITSFIGYNVLFSRGGIIQTDLNTEPSYFNWNKTSGLFSISPQAFTGEVFAIYAT